jgi:hypothetical protein
MKKDRMSYWFSPIVIILSIVVFSGCEKSNNDVKSKLLGTWISTDLTDTIEFSSDNDLYKIIYRFGDHYDYSLSTDSIFIKYNGTQLPLSYMGPPKNHFYQLNGNILTIDFRPYCFGFLSQITTFSRK